MKINLLDPKALEAAAHKFAAESIAEMGDDGKLLKLTYNGTKVRADGPDSLVQRFSEIMGGKLSTVRHG